MMSEQAYDPIELELGGKTYSLRFTVRSARLVEKALGKESMSTVDPMNIGVYLWAMLGNAERATTTVEDVEDMIDHRDLGRVWDAVEKVLVTDMEPAKPGEGKADAAPTS